MGISTSPMWRRKRVAMAIIHPYLFPFEKEKGGVTIATSSLFTLTLVRRRRRRG